MKRRVFIAFGFGAAVFALPFFASAAVLRLTPAAGTFALGSTFDVSVAMDTEGKAVNTIEVEVNFPPDKLQIVNPSLGKSIVQIWPSPPTFSNQEGRIYFIGGVTSPGVDTPEGTVQSFTFRVVAPGEARVSFGKNTSVLANDGLGSDVLSRTSPASFRLILPPTRGPEVFSPTHPEQGRWYSDPNPVLKWNSIVKPEGASYSINHDPTSIPDALVDALNSEATFKNLDSGIWYFHVRERAGGSWGGVSHYALNIDTVPPEAFGVKVSPGERTSSKDPILRLFTTDSLSGFDHFEIKLVPLKDGPSDTSFFFAAASPYQLSGLKAGRYETIGRAYDKAGNFRDESVTLDVLSSVFQFVGPEGIDLNFFFIPWGAIILVLVLIAALSLAFVGSVWRRHRHHLKHAFREDFRRLRLRRSPAVRKQ